jgi:hypothetical protein
MTRKDLRNNILNHRMNLLINCYTNQEKQKKYKLIEYYIRSYNDNYLSSKINNNLHEINDTEENPEQRDEDVEDHYKSIINPNFNPKPQIDYDEYDKVYALKLELEEEEKQREKEIVLENDYNDEYNDDYEYYNSDDNEDYDNDYEFMDDYS